MFITPTTFTRRAYETCKLSFCILISLTHSQFEITDSQTDRDESVNQESDQSTSHVPNFNASFCPLAEAMDPPPSPCHLCLLFPERVFVCVLCAAFSFWCVHFLVCVMYRFLYASSVVSGSRQPRFARRWLASLAALGDSKHAQPRGSAVRSFAPTGPPWSRLGATKSTASPIPPQAYIYIYIYMHIYIYTLAVRGINFLLFMQKWVPNL